MPRFKNKLAAALVMATALASCSDYLNRRDAVSLRAGDAVEGNTAIHAVDPWPPYADKTDVN